MFLNPLDDDAWVLRGGLMDLTRLCDSLNEALEEDGYHNLCFWGENGMSVDEIAHDALIRNGQIRTSTVGALRGLGYEPYRSEPWPHLEVRFDREPTDEELKALVRVFGEPVENPDPKE